MDEIKIILLCVLNMHVVAKTSKTYFEIQTLAIKCIRLHDVCLALLRVFWGF